MNEPVDPRVRALAEIFRALHETLGVHAAIASEIARLTVDRVIENERWLAPAGNA